MGARANVAEDDGSPSAYRGDGKVYRESRSKENQRRTAFERIEVISAANDKARMTNKRSETSSAHSDFVIPSSLDIRQSSFSGGPIATAAKMAELVGQIEDV